VKFKGEKILKKFRFVIFALVILIILVGVTSAIAGSDEVKYQYLVSTGLVCDPDPPPGDPVCPNIATAANGDWIVFEGEGNLSIHPKTADGGGSFTHYFADGGSVVGTWEATELLSFSSYGPSPQFPPAFESGRARMKVKLLVEGEKVADAILTVGCLLPEVEAPGGVFEGATLNVRGGPNFSKLGGEGSFATVFILQ
jgi:hypothetical protein